MIVDVAKLTKLKCKVISEFNKHLNKSLIGYSIESYDNIIEIIYAIDFIETYEDLLNSSFINHYLNQ